MRVTFPERDAEVFGKSDIEKRRSEKRPRSKLNDAEEAFGEHHGSPAGQRASLQTGPASALLTRESLQAPRSSPQSLFPAGSLHVHELHYHYQCVCSVRERQYACMHTWEGARADMQESEAISSVMMRWS